LTIYIKYVIYFVEVKFKKGGLCGQENERRKIRPAV
jgi:hypothetical protein